MPDISKIASRRALIAAAAAMACGMLPRAASAGAAIVYDPVNWVENALAAYEAVRTYMTQLQQYYTQVDSLKAQYQQLTNEYAQLRSLSGSDLSRYLSGMLTKSGRTEEARLMGSVASMSDGVERLTKSYQTRMSVAREAKMTWSEYVTAETTRLQRREQSAIARLQAERAAGARIEADYEYVQSAGVANANSTGTHQSLQLLNQNVMRLITTNAEANRQIASIMGTQEAERLVQQNEEDARRIEQERRFREQQLAETAKVNLARDRAISTFRSMGSNGTTPTPTVPKSGSPL